MIVNNPKLFELEYKIRKTFNNVLENNIVRGFCHKVNIVKLLFYS